MAARQPPRRHPKTAERAMAGNCLHGVLAARRRVTACARQPGRNPHLVGAQHSRDDRHAPARNRSPPRGWSRQCRNLRRGAAPRKRAGRQAPKSFGAGSLGLWPPRDRVHCMPHVLLCPRAGALPRASQPRHSIHSVSSCLAGARAAATRGCNTTSQPAGIWAQFRRASARRRRRMRLRSGAGPSRRGVVRPRRESAVPSRRRTANSTQNGPPRRFPLRDTSRNSAA